MACERNRIIELKEYLLSLGIKVNIGKNKARGHKGIFMHRFGGCRIDISDNVPQENVLSVILHEFAHYIHYSYDTTLHSLDFIFGEFSDELREELIKITVKDIPKEFATALCTKKSALNEEIKDILKKIKVYEPGFKLSENNKSIEKNISYPVKYLLKYDRVKIGDELYSLDKLEKSKIGEKEMLYMLLKSKQRAVKRINSRISRLNKYYNNPTELFARFLDSYYTKAEYTRQNAPVASSILSESNNPFITKLNQIFN